MNESKMTLMDSSGNINNLKSQQAERTLQLIEAAKVILANLKGYIIPDPDKDYKPTYLTKRLVANAFGLTLYSSIGDTSEKEEYRDINEDNIFSYFEKLISSNGIYDIPSTDSIYRYIRNIVNLYFKTYYAQAINTIKIINQNYFNLIENQIVTLKILSKLLDKVIM